MVKSKQTVTLQHRQWHKP